VIDRDGSDRGGLGGLRSVYRADSASLNPSARAQPVLCDTSDYNVRVGLELVERGLPRGRREVYVPVMQQGHIKYPRLGHPIRLGGHGDEPDLPDKVKGSLPYLVVGARAVQGGVARTVTYRLSS